jgi:hypothetical protein
VDASALRAPAPLNGALDVPSARRFVTLIRTPTEFRVRLRQRNVPEDELVADLRRVAAELSKDTVTANEYSEIGRFGVNTYLRRFKRWNAALNHAGLSAPNKQHILREDLFANIATVWTRIGRQPTGKEMKKALGLSDFSLGTYEKRFGSWNKALLAFDVFINEGDQHQTLEQAATPIFRPRIRTGAKVNWRLRAQVLIRDSCICRMCGASPAKDAGVVLHADHIVPWSKGGETTLANLQTLCQQCNIGKGDIHEEESSRHRGDI